VTTLNLKQNDRLPKLRATLTDGSGNPIDLTGSSVVFRMKNFDGTGSLKVNGAATVITPAAGIVEYAWAAGDTDTAGTWIGEFAVTLAGLVQTVPSSGYVVVVIQPVLS